MAPNRYKCETKSRLPKSILSKLRVFLEFVVFFFQNSSIHGLSHIIARKHPLENLVWLGLVSGAVYGAAVLSRMTLIRYRENPTVISMERDRFSWNTSFPAATICPTNKIDLESLDYYLNSTSNVKNKTAFREFMLSLSEASYENFDDVVHYDEVPADEYMVLLKRFQFKFRPMVTNSGLNGEQLTLLETVTEMGICYSFNSHLAVYNSFDYWSKQKWKLLPQNETFALNPLDGEVFANVVNMSSGFQITKFGRDVLFQYTTTYFSQSSIHCWRYLVDKKLTKFDKAWWMSFIIATICGVAIISYATFAKYIENPTVISIDKDRYSWNTSFPSVTLCPHSKINENLLDDYVKSSTAVNKTLLKEFLVNLAYADYNNLDQIPYYDGIPGEIYLQLLLDLQNDFVPFVSNTGLANFRFTVHRVITEMGFCYSLNSKLAIYNTQEYWDQELWQLVEDTVETLNITAFDDDVSVSMENISGGYNAYIHGPYEVADVASKYIRSLDGYFLQLYLSGLTLFSSESIKSLGVNQRKCRFYYESDLRHSPVYSYVLCRMECRANLANRLCGCTPHFYRKLDGERVCDVTGLHCLSKYKDRLTILKNECSCLANCDEVNYVVEETDGREWFLGSNLQWGLKYYPKMRLRRDVIFGFSDLLVYIGGMVGLFLGCSVLSFIEIVYFFTLRLYWFIINHEKPRGCNN